METLKEFLIFAGWCVLGFNFITIIPMWILWKIDKYKERRLAKNPDYFNGHWLEFFLF